MFSYLCALATVRLRTLIYLSCGVTGIGQGPKGCAGDFKQESNILYAAFVLTLAHCSRTSAGVSSCPESGTRARQQ